MGFRVRIVEIYVSMSLRLITFARFGQVLGRDTLRSCQRSEYRIVVHAISANLLSAFLDSVGIAAFAVESFDSIEICCGFAQVYRNLTI